MMKSPMDWMPLERHKRSQNAGPLYALALDGVEALDTFMRISLLLVFDSLSVPVHRLYMA